MTLFVGAFFLLVLPLLWLASIRHWWNRPTHRRRLWAGVLAILYLAAPWMPWNPAAVSPISELLKAKLLILVVVVSVLAARLAGIDWARDRSRRLEIWVVLVLVAIPLYYNFFYFHGLQIFVHRHDLGHYYLGAKYYDELGYQDLYTAMIRAEAETTGGHFLSPVARDLGTNKVVDIRHLLEKSGPVKARFTAERWQEFQADTAHLRKRLGPEYRFFVGDHGFNPPPTWVLIARPLANLVAPGSNAGLLALALLDVCLLATAFCFVFWAFGGEAALLGVLHFCLVSPRASTGSVADSFATAGSSASSWGCRCFIGAATPERADCWLSA